MKFTKKKLLKIQKRVAKQRDKLRNHIGEMEMQAEALDEALEDIKEGIESLDRAADTLSQFQ